MPLSLLEEIKAERAQVILDTKTFAETILGEVRESIELTGDCTPVVGAIVGAQKELYLLSWKDEHQKAQAFANLNAALSQRDVAATVCVLPGLFTPQGQDPLSAVVVMMRTATWKEVSIYTHAVANGQVEWGGGITTSTYDSPLITVPEPD